MPTIITAQTPQVALGLVSLVERKLRGCPPPPPPLLFPPDPPLLPLFYHPPPGLPPRPRQCRHLDPKILLLKHHGSVDAAISEIGALDGPFSAEIVPGCLSASRGVLASPPHMVLGLHSVIIITEWRKKKNDDDDDD